MDFTKERIEDLKKKHGKVFLFECASDNSKSCILRAATRNDLSLANVSALSRNEAGASNFDVQKFNESILLSTWIDGDEEIKTDDSLFLGISEQLDSVIQKAKFSVKEL